jgi:hypothetical protein
LFKMIADERLHLGNGHTDGRKLWVGGSHNVPPGW